MKHLCFAVFLIIFFATPAPAQDYEKGMAALTRGNTVLAERWFQIAAGNNHVEAQFELARIYDEGRGARRNYEIAFHWYKRAATGGHLEAASILGIFYEEGKGVKQDLLQAYIWYRVAADQITFAEFSRGFLESQLSEDEVREGERRAADLKATLPEPKPEKSAANTSGALDRIVPAAGSDLPTILEQIAPAGGRHY